MALRLVLSSLFIGASVLLIRVYWTEHSDVPCSETIIGQEMYRLVIFYFLIIIILNLVIETVNSFLFYKMGLKFLPEPEFDIRYVVGMRPLEHIYRFLILVATQRT